MVLNPTTGAVLAMVSNPTFDPNPLANPDITWRRAYDFSELQKDHEGFAPITPIATEERFAPGSTFKVVTSTAVYNLDPSLKNFSFKLVPYPLKFSDSTQTLSNDGGSPCGGTMVTMLPASCDPGYAKLGAIARGPHPDQAGDAVRLRHYGSKNQYMPNIDIPNVIPSTFSNLEPSSQAFLAPQRHRTGQRAGHPAPECPGGGGHRRWWGDHDAASHGADHATPRATW